MTKKTVYIFEPALAKSKAMAAMLQAATEPVEVCWVALDEQEKASLAGQDAQLWQEVKSQLNEHSVLLPSGIISTEVVLEQARLHRNHAYIDQTVLQVCHKPWLLEQAQKVDVPVPETWLNSSDIKSFPVFYKEEYEAGGGVRGIANSVEELPNLPNKSLIYQELIVSQGTYGFAFWAEAGEVKAAVSHFEQYSFPASGGSAVFIQCFEDERLNAHAKALLAELSYTGWGLVEFKFDPKRNDYVLMEINSKIWASIEFSLRNNAKLAEYILGAKTQLKPYPKILFWDNFSQMTLGFIFRHLSLLRHKVISYNGLWRSLYQRLRGK